MTKNILLLLSAVIFTSACFAQQTNKNDELFRKAAVYIEAKRLPEAKDILYSISVKSRDDEFYMNLLNGQISLEQDTPQLALSYFKKAQNLSDSSYRSALGLALANIKLGNTTAARINAETLRTMDPGSGDAELIISSCEMLIGKTQIAIDRMNKLIQSKPDSSKYAVAYAKFLIFSGEVQRAHLSLSTFIQQHPNSPEALELSANIEYLSGSAVSALELMGKAANLYKINDKNFNHEVALAWIEINEKSKGLLVEDLKKESTPVEVLQKSLPIDENLKKSEPIALIPKAKPTTTKKPAVNFAEPKVSPFPFPSGVMITAGSGFIVDSGRKVVTNRHVVEGGKEFAVRTGLGEIITAKLLFLSPTDDLAVLELIDPLPAERAISPNAYSKPGVGRNVVVMGYPLWSMLGQGAPSLTNGMVSKRTGLQDDKGTFQITAKVNKGNSGGPVFDLSGNVVGITVGKLDTKKIQDEQGFIPEDINFAIHVDRLPPMVNMRLESKEPSGLDLGTEELYQAMLGKVVMVATYK